MTFKCIHLADVHFRGLKRHDEYRKVFTSFFKKAKEISPDVIYVGGDIVHSKTQGISPELIDTLNWWFTELAKICPTHIILGNHDGLLNNKDRQDAITPIVKALNNENIFLYKKSGTYSTGIEGYNWCVFSCFDEEGYKNVKPIENEINIALYHGCVVGSKTDLDWELEGEVKSNFFDKFDFAFLGDIHKRQYLNAEKTIAYPGSTIQQNYGEETEKGFLLWEIKNKNDFISKFIKLENPYKFVTIDWENSINKTLEKIKKNVEKKSRLRVNINSKVSQIEIETLYEKIKETISPTEIVFKISNEKEILRENKVIINKILDIKSEANRTSFLKENYENLSEKEIQKVNLLFNNNLEKLPKELDYNSNKWSLKELEFNNTFSYGKNNKINFDKLKGVVGIFGKNRSGKSSIPGTLMYCLFNSTDRGNMKNIHIINNRKARCFARATLNIDGKDYFIERKTKKNSTKKGEVWSSTDLSLTTMKDSVEIDQSEEQRRETEKILRNLIGTRENFLYTSFSSQGEINKFISEKSSVRKNILSNFLGLNIYEDLYKNSREEYSYLKLKIKNLENKDWSNLVKENLEKIESYKLDLQKCEEKINNCNEKLLNFKLSLSKINDSLKRHPSGYTLHEIKTKVNKKLNLIEKREKNLLSLYKEKEDILEKIKKFEIFKESFSLDEIKSEKERLKVLAEKKILIENSIENSLKDKKSSDDKINILNDVPCNDSFPNCKFIKDAYKEKSERKNYKNIINELKSDLYEIKNAVSDIDLKEIEIKIEKYNKIINNEYKTKIDLKSISDKIVISEKEIVTEKENLIYLENILKDILKLEDASQIEKEKLLKKEIVSIEEEIKIKEVSKRKILSEILYLENNIKTLEKESKEYQSIIEEFRAYENFSKLVSKKGIPSILTSSLLPKINHEINNILKGITSFSIQIENENNNLEVYIMYEDSKRVIECGSGMEKMMTSIAIRVALINITNLSKPDFFIIDEGFGALDETNIEACSRLLQSLKNYFKSIIIISHVDAIKDVVDDILKIESRGKDLYVRY